MKTACSTTRKGMTIATLMIVIAVIAILATMMMLSSTEAIATAKATRIIANLQILKRATIAWYADNRDKVTLSDVPGSQVAGMVKIGNEIKPIQEWSENDIQLSRYISGGDMSEINLHDKTENDKYSSRKNTNLSEGCYGICDGGRIMDGTTIRENHRSQWYVGYRFTEGEEVVREKIRGMMNTAGVFLGTADAHKDENNDNSAAVWMRVL